MQFSVQFVLTHYFCCFFFVAAPVSLLLLLNAVIYGANNIRLVSTSPTSTNSRLNFPFSFSSFFYCRTVFSLPFLTFFFLWLIVVVVNVYVNAKRKRKLLLESMNDFFFHLKIKLST